MAVRWATRTPGGGFGFAFERRRLALAPRDALRAPETRFDASNVPSDWNHGTRAPVVGGRPLSLAADERGRALAIARSFAQREDAAGNLSEASLSLTIAYQLCDPGRARSFSTNTTHTNVNFPGVDAGSCSTSGCHATVTKVGTIDYVASPRANPGSGNWYWCRRNDPTP
jgi:hypothetical protein